MTCGAHAPSGFTDAAKRTCPVHSVYCTHRADGTLNMLKIIPSIQYKLAFLPPVVLPVVIHAWGGTAWGRRGPVPIWGS